MQNLQITSDGPVVLVILDGWGLAPDFPGNAISLANTPTMKKLWAAYPHTQLLASGEAVGLPKNEPGNSETGHLNIGAGRVVYQDLPRINLSIADGSFFEKKAFLNAIDHVKKFSSSLNLIGLIGSGGVHSSLEHLFALLRLAAENNLKNVYLHLFTDGRDSPPQSSTPFLKNIENELNLLKIGEIATICGRYYAMDRDNRWERVQKAYEVMTSGIGAIASTAEEAVSNSYQLKVTDEFVLPTVIHNNQGSPIKIISDNDAVIFFNFRIDRPRELTKAFVLPDFESYCPKISSFDPYAEKYGQKQFSSLTECPKTFKRKVILKNLFFVTMTQYEEGLKTEVAFLPPKANLPLARVFSDAQIRQFHIAETEKFPHVTNFLDGGAGKPFYYEEWAQVQSSKVATYDLFPQMSAEEVTNQFIKRFQTRQYPFALINFANPDMVGHTGVISAAIKACETTDFYLGKIVDEVLAQEGTIIVTADHGNVEEMINLETGQPDTEHSSNPVPLIIVNNQLKGRNICLQSGVLSDIAPTILSISKVNVPEEMTGRNLLD